MFNSFAVNLNIFTQSNLHSQTTTQLFSIQDYKSSWFYSL